MITNTFINACRATRAPSAILSKQIFVGLCITGLTLLWTSCKQDEIQVTIAAPTDNSDFAATDDLTVTIAVTGDFVLDGAAAGQSNEDGHGHWHLIVDAGTDDETTLVQSGATSETVNLTSLELVVGVHTVTAELRQNDHTPLDPTVSDVVEINIVQ